MRSRRSLPYVPYMLFHADRKQRAKRSSDQYFIAGFHTDRFILLYLLSVDHSAVPRSQIHIGPFSAAVPGQNSLVPGYAEIINLKIAGLGTADRIFPVGNRDILSVFNMEIRPDFGRTFAFDQRKDRMKQNKRSKNNK